MLQNDISSFKDIQSKNSTYSHLLAEKDLLLKGFNFFKQALAFTFFRLRHLFKHRQSSCSNQRMIHIVVYMHVIGRFLMCIFRSKGLLEVSKICTRSTFKIHNGKGGYLLSLAIKNYPTITIKVIDIIAIESVHERKNSNVNFVTKSFSLNSDFKKHVA